MLPGLFAVPKMSEAGPDSDFYKLQWTETVRQRNRIHDGLTDAIAVADRYLKTTAVTA